MENEGFRMLDDKAIFTAMMVVDYFPRVCFTEMHDNEQLEEAFVKVYNRLLDELIERGVLEC